jgi:hypothetical protein
VGEALVHSPTTHLTLPVEHSSVTVVALVALVVAVVLTTQPVVVEVLVDIQALEAVVVVD